MSQIIIPDSIASQLPMEAVRRAFASLGLVLDGGAVVGAELGTQRAWQARWASDAIHDQRCADPGCPRLPATLVSGTPYCALHGRRHMEETRTP